MRLLLDAQALLWFIWDHPNLSAPSRAALSDPGNELLLSMGTYWEIAIKVGIKKLTLAESFESFMNGAIVDNHVIILPITVRHAAELIGLPVHHRDPFDRLLIAQALVEGIPIVSNDTAFDAYPITRIW